MNNNSLGTFVSDKTRASVINPLGVPHECSLTAWLFKNNKKILKKYEKKK